MIPMKKWIATLLAFVMLTGLLAGCKEEINLTPDDEMTIAISALARSANALKEAARPSRYTVTGSRTLDGVKTNESVTKYDTEQMVTLAENQYYQDGELIRSEITYTFITSQLAGSGDSFSIVTATTSIEADETIKEYTIEYTGEDPLDVQNYWVANGYGPDMTYQTYGRIEDLIVSCALSQGGAKAKVTSAKDFTLDLMLNNRTERYTVTDNLITQFVWTEMTTSGEDESIWNYQWNAAEITLPDLSDFTFVTE